MNIKQLRVPSEINCSDTDNSGSVTIDADNPPPTKKRNSDTLFKNHEQDQEEQTTVLSIEQKLNKELEDFITSPKLDFEENLLSWWKIHSGTYPTLSVVAKKYMYLCVCATSSASERLFSVSGNIVSPTRNSLEPDKVELH